ncbi:MAG: hypothetical protein LBG79_00995 [Spirochaetaceae bacterium]|jgi:hypothetical protein|nr:hypothetical protein [Spirochaetaceae bacterium]GMO16945.1 MAG: hypothetical protein Pg6A_03110 [Termitinemataceae bacterium]
MERATAAAQVIVAIIPIVGIVMGSVVVFFYLLWGHKRKSMLIQSGQYQRPAIDLELFSLFTGLLLSGVGLCLTLFLMVATDITMELLGGVIPLSLGISLLLFFVIKRKLRA